MDILREKKGQHPSATRKPGERRSRITSAAIVRDDDDDEDSSAESTSGAADGEILNSIPAPEHEAAAATSTDSGTVKKAPKPRAKKGKARAISPPIVVKDYRTAQAVPA